MRIPSRNQTKMAILRCNKRVRSVGAWLSVRADEIAEFEDKFEEEAAASVRVEKETFEYHLNLISNHHGWESAAELFSYAKLLIKDSGCNPMRHLGRVEELLNSLDGHCTLVSDRLYCRLYKSVSSASRLWLEIKSYLKEGIEVRRIGFRRWDDFLQPMIAVFVKRVNLDSGAYRRQLLEYVPDEKERRSYEYEDLMTASYHNLHDHVLGEPIWIVEEHGLAAEHISEIHARGHRIIRRVFKPCREAWGERLPLETWLDLLCRTEVQSEDDEESLVLVGKFTDTKLEWYRNAEEYEKMLSGLGLEWLYLPQYAVFVPSILGDEYRYYMATVTALKRCMSRFVAAHFGSIDRLLWLPDTGLMPLRICKMLSLYASEGSSSKLVQV